MLEALGEKLSTQQRQGLWRELRARQSAQAVTVTYAHQTYLNFNSNDYLGLSYHPDVLRAFQTGAQQYGLGSGSANTLSGYTQAHEDLSQALSAWLKRDKTILFSSGYLANLAVLTTLIAQEDKVYADKLNHASLMDGMRYSGANFKRYPHLNLDKLATLLSANTDAQAWVITESLFSMDGDGPDLHRLMKLAQTHQAHVVVDEAHSLGLYGDEGSGMLSAAGITQAEVPVMVGTFGKSFGTQGAFVSGQAQWIEALIQFARPYLFTTALSPAMAAATHQSLSLIQKADDARAHVMDLVDYFKQCADARGLKRLPSDSPIQPLVFDSIEAAQTIADTLKSKHILAPCIRYPTVPKDSPRLRLTLTAQHTRDDIDTFMKAMDEARHV